MNLPATGIPLVDLALRLLGQHAYLITLGATTLENLFIVGSVTPGETIVMAAGFVSSSGVVSPFGVFAASVLGSVTGSNISYLLGRRGGRPMIERYGHRIFRNSERRLEDAEGYFVRHGTKTILFARFAPGVKNFAPVVAGVSHMNFLLFQVYTVLGAVVYSAAMVSLGYFFGSNFKLLLKIVGRAGWVGLIVALGVIGFGLWERRRFIRRREAADIAAFEASADVSAEEPADERD